MRESQEAIAIESRLSTRRWGRKCSIVKLEIDGFQRYARRQDAREVERALFIAGLVLKCHARRGCLVGSGTGGKFTVLLSGIGPRRAATFAKQVTLDIASQLADNGTPLTVSSGVASRDGSVTHADQLVEMAESALRAAKWQGGNRVAGGNFGRQPRWLPQRSWLEAVRFVRSA